MGVAVAGGVWPAGVSGYAKGQRTAVLADYPGGIVATPQQPELHRSGLTPADPSSAKSRAAAPRPAGEDGLGPIPEDNLPGHHPEEEQDKPVEAFVARASRPRRRAAGAGSEAGAGSAGAGGADAVGARRGGASARGRATAERDDSADEASPTGLADHAGGRASSAPPRPATAGAGGAGAAPWYAVVPALAFVDALRHPADSWDAAGESKNRWLAEIALVPVIGPWRYATNVKARLDAAERAKRLTGA